MQQGISTHIFLQQRLTPALLDALVRGGASAIEVFAARHHFDYADRAAVKELAGWFAGNNVIPSLHMPLFSDEAQWSRHTAPTLNLIDTNKGARIETMDEVKRALEAAEQVPFTACVLHLGKTDDQWDNRALDDSLTAIEHLKAFAGPLGVKLLLENLPNEVATPEHLLEIVRVGHFGNVGFCLDIGHANLTAPIAETSHAPAKDGIAQAFEAFAAQPDRLLQMQLHDNHGLRDEHLWPGDGSIDWAATARRIAELKNQPTAFLELAHELGEDAASVSTRAGAVWGLLA